LFQISICAGKSVFFFCAGSGLMGGLSPLPVESCCDRLDLYLRKEATDPRARRFGSCTG
jgi:hypothetical protein